MRLESWWFLSLWLLIPLFFRVWKNKGRGGRLLFSRSVPPSEIRFDPYSILFALRVLAFGLLVVALARPQWSTQLTERTLSGVDIGLVLDVSMSMDIEDFEAGVSRLDNAGKAIGDFIRARSSDRMSLVTFSGEPVTLAPLTLDHDLLLNSLGEIQTGVLKDGTGIGDGIALAVSRMKDSKAKSRVIVLLTDGDNNAGKIDPVTAGDLAAGFGIKIYSIAFGKEGEGRIPQKGHDFFGREVKQYQVIQSSINPDLLEQISKNTSGRMFRAQDLDALKKVYAEIDRLEKSEAQIKTRARYDEAFATWLIAGIFLLLICEVLGRTVLRVLP